MKRLKIITSLLIVIAAFCAISCASDVEYKNPLTAEQLTEFLSGKKYGTELPYGYKFSFEYERTDYITDNIKNDLAGQKIQTTASVSGLIYNDENVLPSDPSILQKNITYLKYSGKYKCHVTTPSVYGTSKESITQNESAVYVGDKLYLAYKCSESNSGGSLTTSGKTASTSVSKLYDFIKNYFFSTSTDLIFHTKNTVSPAQYLSITSSYPITECLTNYMTDNSTFDYVFTQGSSLILMQSRASFEKTFMYTFSGNRNTGLKITYNSARENYVMTLKYTSDVPDLKPPKNAELYK